MTDELPLPNPVSAAARRRQQRRNEILEATRELFDARGLGDAQIEDIAKAVGINRAIIYRHFSGKEELFAMTLVGYLEEIRSAMLQVDDPAMPPADRLRAISASFLDFGEKYPAFVDCALDLLRRPGNELLEEVNAHVLVKLGAGVAGCLDALVEVFEAGMATGEFHIVDPNLLANVLYTQALGGLSLARLQLRIGANARGEPLVSAIAFDDVKAYLIEGAVALARGAGVGPISS
ncbi:hypothetical protein BH09ACT10_BH09ACT10_01530 [soil metagenome]